MMAGKIQEPSIIFNDYANLCFEKFEIVWNMGLLLVICG